MKKTVANIPSFKSRLRNAVTSVIHGWVHLGARSRAGAYCVDQIMAAAIGDTRCVQHGAVNLTFAAPNRLTRARIASFSTKEPETLQWIDGIPSDAVLWDIGANVGLYTCYAAKARRCRVFAFEPSVFNLELLARNVYLNDLTDRVTIVPLALSDGIAFSTLNMTTTDWGGALSTFGHEYGHDGAPLQAIFKFQTVGLSMLDATERLGIPQPDYIKMDVDGIEHLICRGGDAILKRVQSVLIEVDEQFEQASRDSMRCLREAGLTLADRRHSELVAGSLFNSAYNQIWRRA